MAYETVMKEGCGIGSQPILVYATDKALSQESLPLSDALKAFVRFDNRFFKQELIESDRHGHSPERKRGAVLGDDSQSKRLQRTVSLDSMATNQASAGDIDDEMRDIPLGNDSTWGNASGDLAADRMVGEDDLPGLVEFPPLVGETGGSAPLYERDMEMETGVSPALAQVSLQDVKGTIAPRATPEMQERPNPAFLARLSNGGGAASGTAANPIRLVDNENEDGLGHQVNGI